MADLPLRDKEYYTDGLQMDYTDGLQMDYTDGLVVIAESTSRQLPLVQRKPHE